MTGQCIHNHENKMKYMFWHVEEPKKGETHFKEEGKISDRADKGAVCSEGVQHPQNLVMPREMVCRYRQAVVFLAWSQSTGIGIQRVTAILGDSVIVVTFFGSAD